MPTLDWGILAVVATTFWVLYSLLREIDGWAALSWAAVSVLILCTYLAEVLV